jgi:altronate hydrolase
VFFVVQSHGCATRFLREINGVTPPRILRLHEADNVLIACCDLPPNTELSETGLRCTEPIPAGHKVAATYLKIGQPVLRYGQIIGTASRPVAPGQHLHDHNLSMSEHERDYRPGIGYLPTQSRKQSFLGIVRPDGRVGTRNYLAVLSSVNCSATVVRAIADTFTYRPELLADFPDIDGVVGLTHGTGCAMASEGPGLRVLQRTIGGYARHVNFAGVLLIGLGCESNQIRALLEQEGLVESDRLRTFTIQESGGTSKTIKRGIDLLKDMFPAANEVDRKQVSTRHLTLALQCGGSDGYSGITANPALGVAVDRLVEAEGTAILSETPEIYGAEHLLIQRAANQEVAQQLIERIGWWEDYTTRNGATMNNNPSPGNKAGGITTILEKSLGAVAKGGSTGLMAVYEYAEQVTGPGLVFMDTPGYDPVSATGQVAGGANLICFTTGRGSAFGGKPAPSIKLSTNSTTYLRQMEDIDINCGEILDGTATLGELGDRIYQKILAVASGERTKSEELGYGENEFVPWVIGATM